MPNYRIANATPTNNYPKIQCKCPHCNSGGTFDRLDVNDITTNTSIIGIRRCPNPDCLSVIFFIKGNIHGHFSDLWIFPSTKIDFRKDGIPDKVLRAFEEAIICHSNDCYIASAIMLRKTLEEICYDQGATGTNLFKRLDALSRIIIVPKQLIDATQELRLLGNDAAHLESQTYEEIGKTEIEISIEFTKEILKAVYQYEGLLGKLRELKRAQPGSEEK